MILLATDIIGAIEGQQTLGGIPMTVRRNAFGRQVDSAEVELTWLPDGSPMHATFIRAPWVESWAPEVEVLAIDEAHGRTSRSGRGRGAARQCDCDEFPPRDPRARRGARRPRAPTAGRSRLSAAIECASATTIKSPN